MTIAKILLTTALAAAALNASAAVGTVSVSASLTSPQAGAVTVDFDSATPAGISYTGGYIANGNLSGEYAAPIGTGGNFYTLGTSSYQSGVGTATFAGAGATYFGFYLASPDGANTVTYYGSDNSVTTYNGNQLVAYTSGNDAINADGNQGHGFFFGATATAGTTFTKVEFSSSSNAMETDNHAFISAVPEPETYAMMLAGLGLVGFIARRKARRQA